MMPPTSRRRKRQYMRDSRVRAKLSRPLIRLEGDGDHSRASIGNNVVELDMPAYLIVEHTITDPAKFQEYGNKVRPLVAKYGGRSLARGSHRVLETKHWMPDRVIIFEFPDMKTLNTWYNAPEYQPLKALRQSAVDMSKDMMIAVNGT